MATTQFFRLHRIYLGCEAKLMAAARHPTSAGRPAGNVGGYAWLRDCDDNRGLSESPSDDGFDLPQRARKAKNQALFREVNERIAELAARFEVASGPQAFICECSQVGCTECFELPVAAYARVRDDPATFLVLAGHEDVDHETVLERSDGYLLVRNKPGVAELPA